MCSPRPALLNEGFRAISALAGHASLLKRRKLARVLQRSRRPSTKSICAIKRLCAALRGGVCVSNTRGSTVQARGAEGLLILHEEEPEGAEATLSPLRCVAAFVRGVSCYSRLSVGLARTVLWDRRAR